MADKQDPETADRRLRRGAEAAICIGAVALAVRLFFRSVFGVALPFLLAYLLSRLIRPVVDGVCHRRRIPRGLVSALAVVLIAGGAVILTVGGIRRGVTELSRFVSSVAEDSDGLVATVDDLADRLESATAHIPVLRRLRDHEGYAALTARIDGLIASALTRLGEALADRLPGLAMSLASGVPNAFLFLTVLLLACYYFTADNGRLRRGAAAMADRLLPPSARRMLPAFGHRLALLGRGYLRASLLLMGMTFLLCFIGLSLLSIKYAFLIGLVLAVVDFLPLLGTGVILVPWAVIAALMGHPVTAVGIGVLWVVCTLARQLAEPRLMGAGLDIHPLVSLASIYVGLILFGIPGMLMAPILTAAVKVTVFEPR